MLTPQEADQLFAVLDRLEAEGRAAILYISHKLEEVKRLCGHRHQFCAAARRSRPAIQKAETAGSLAAD